MVILGCPERRLFPRTPRPPLRALVEVEPYRRHLMNLLVYSPVVKLFRPEDFESVSIDPKSFAGGVRSIKVASDVGGVSVHVYRVEFDAGGRTEWHRHTGAQWLLIIAGRIRVQKWGEAPQDVGAGDIVVFEPGEKHWHGAAPGSAGTHLAVNLNSTTEWLEAVSDGPVL